MALLPQHQLHHQLGLRHLPVIRAELIDVQGAHFHLNSGQLGPLHNEVHFVCKVHREGALKGWGQDVISTFYLFGVVDIFVSGVAVGGEIRLWGCLVLNLLAVGKIMIFGVLIFKCCLGVRVVLERNLGDLSGSVPSEITTALNF